ncbi:MAG TPA: heme exporter protein CcmD [Rhizomicrobium sp.]|jgi:heme exporter protein CcmD|nr:heme exporter protein CcmD [Rhizomicrobium sp.]
MMLDMGKYAAFVWPAYGVSFAGLVIGIALTLSAYRRAKAKFAALEKR